MPRKDQPEFRLQCAVADLLRFCAKPDVYWSALPMGEKRTLATGARLKRMGVRPGAGDLLILAPATVPIMLELKTEKGRLSDTQKATQVDWEKAGGKYFVASGYQMAHDFLEIWGIIKPDRSIIKPKQEDAA
jgi:hypothetical protein